jgi:hypothetical protein
MVLGTYSGMGDPGEVLLLLGIARFSVLATGRWPGWIVAATALLGASVLVMRTWLSVQDRVFGPAGVMLSLRRVIATLGIAGGAIAILLSALPPSPSGLRARMRDAPRLGARTARAQEIVAWESAEHPAEDRALRAEHVRARLERVDDVVPPTLPIESICVAIVLVGGLGGVLTRARRRER